MQKHTGALWNLKFDCSKMMTSAFDQTALCWNFNGIDSLSEDKKRLWGIRAEDIDD
jgi:hypothetical protein